MKYNDLPQHWKERLSTHLRTELKVDRDTLTADDFTDALQIEFEDMSRIHFNYAFHIADEAMEEVAVFTEHCGYHLFPFHETKFDRVRNRYG